MKIIFTFLITFITLNSFSQIIYYENREALHDNCSATLTLEDFSSGPTDNNTGCTGDFSSEGNSCFPADEIQEGIIVTSNDSDSLVYSSGKFITGDSDNPPGVGVGDFDTTKYTIVNFTNDVNTVAMEVCSLLLRLVL